MIVPFLFTVCIGAIVLGVICLIWGMNAGYIRSHDLYDAFLVFMVIAVITGFIGGMLESNHYSTRFNRVCRSEGYTPLEGNCITGHVIHIKVK